MIADTLSVLNDVSFYFGLIGINEYIERREIALWLDDDSGQLTDPRNVHNENQHPEGEENTNQKNLGDMGPSKSNGQDTKKYMEFTFQNKWVFTKSDPDPYPSTPHGHFYNSNNSLAKTRSLYRPCF